MVGYKINIKNWIIFLHTSSEKSENNTEKTIPFTAASKNNKTTNTKPVYVKLQTILERN